MSTRRTPGSGVSRFGGGRRKGLGALLICMLQDEARRLGFAQIDCAASAAVALLQREGWTEQVQPVHDGTVIRIFQRAL